MTTDDCVPPGLQSAIEENEALIQEAEQRVTALKLEAEKRKREALDWFRDLTPEERTDVYRSNPELYRQGMEALRRRNTAKYLNRGR